MARDAQKVVEGLRGEAFDVARDLGFDILCGEGRLEALVEAMRYAVFPLKEAEAKEPFRQGHKT